MEIVPVRSSCCCLVCGGSCDMCPILWSKLPEELFIELLQRLPEEALLRFRCVSKGSNFVITKLFIPKLAASARVAGFVFQWQRTIYPKKYRGSYFRFNPVKEIHPPKDYYGYVTETGDSYAHEGGELVKSYLSLLPFEPITDDFLGCFNGFFLVRNSSFVPIQYFVCNPATRQCLPIPLNPKHVQKDSFVGLAFDPLGPPPHNFKIVRVDYTQLDPQPWEVDVFSSTTGKWVNHQIPLESKILKFKWNMRSTYVDGVFYMLSMCSYLLCFDLDPIEDNALKARAIELPYRCRGYCRSYCYGLFEKSNGCLFYACKADDDLLVWTFQVSNEASPWTLKYNISTLDLAQLRYGYFLSHLKEIFAVDLSAEIIYVGSGDTVFTYDIKNNKADKFGSIKYGYMLYAESLCFYPYSCCLIRLSDRFSPSQQLLG